MTIVQALFLISIVMLLMIVLDWLLGKVKSDWDPLPWEISEQEERDNK